MLPRPLRPFLTQLPYLPKAIGLVWEASGYWTLIWAVLLIFLGILPALEVYLVKAVVDSFVAVSRTEVHSTNLSYALTCTALLVGLLLLGGAVGNFNTWVRTFQAELTQDYMSSLIHRKAISLDLAFFESSDYYNRLHRAHVEARNHPIALLENLGELIRSTLTLLSVVVVLVPLGIWLPLGLLANTLPPVYIVYKSNKRENQWRVQNTLAQRYTDYYDNLLTSCESAAELRLFALGEHFQTAYHSLRLRLRQDKMKLMRERSVAQFGANFLSLVIVGITLSWIVGQIARGKLSLGDLALLLQSLWLAQGMLQNLLKSLSKSYQNLLFLQDLFEFLTLKSQNSEEQGVRESICDSGFGRQLIKGICFEDVSFCYPGTQRLALDGFTLTISAGQIVAIVGENGAGKSTLVKLLCRFFDQKLGKITLDGKEIRDLPLAELRSLITALFQFPVHYNDTAANNIALSTLTTNPTRSEIEAVAQATGADIPIQQLSTGYDTLLGKWFGGAELSGGQWQRIALARAWLRPAPIVILDEPTSAMDTWAEANWLKRLRQLAQGRTVIIITHRLTTAQQADIIHVMAKGQVVESGTHEELLAKGGGYAQSWQVQSKKQGGGM